MSDLRGQTEDGAELYTEDVSRAYRLAAREAPGPEVDAAIHAAAVRAAGSPSRFHRRRRGAWWGVPIAVATTIVIGVSVAFLASDRPDPVSQSNESQRSLPAPSAVPRTEVPAADAARQTPQPAGEAGGQAPVAAAAREARPTRERTTRDQAVPRREHYASRPPAPASAAGPEAADAAPAAPSAAAIEAPQPPAVSEAARSMRKTAPEVRSTEENEPLSPEVWLQRIRELRSKGEVVQADESLRAFRRRYPDYPLPADVPPPAQVGK